MIPAKSADRTSSQPGPRQRKQQLREVPDSVIVRHGDVERLAAAHQLIDEWAVTGPFRMMLEAYQPRRSDVQHGLFYAWCEITARHLRAAGQACTKDAVHDWICGTVYGWEDIGLGRQRPRRTLTRPHQMGKLDMIELLNRFEAEATEQFDLQLPRPNTWEQDLEDQRKSKSARTHQ